MSRPSFTRRALVLAPALLVVGLFASPLQAHAMLTTCRTDPIVRLSNGVQVSLSATLADSAADVTNIRYTLHAPAGTSVTSVVYTGGAFANKETFVFFADAPAHTYTTATVAKTATSGIKMSAATIATSPSGQVAASVSGTSGQALTTQVGL